jgi:hypothetical protein
LNVTPLGSAPDSLSVGVGEPVTVTVNEPAVPTVNVVTFPLVMAGPWFTTNVKLCTAFEPIPLLAVKLMLYVPAVPAAGVPLSTPVPALNVTPPGSAPVSLSVGTGNPVVITMNDPAAPTVKVVLFPLVTFGPSFTVSVKFCTAFDPAPLLAVKVML